MARRPHASGRFAYEGLDRVMHERARLSVLTSLASQPRGLAFADVKRLGRLTYGNLSRHRRILEEAQTLVRDVGDQRQAAVIG